VYVGLCAAATAVLVAAALQRGYGGAAYADAELRAVLRGIDARHEAVVAGVRSLKAAWRLEVTGLDPSVSKAGASPDEIRRIPRLCEEATHTLAFDRGRCREVYQVLAPASRRTSSRACSYDGRAAWRYSWSEDREGWVRLPGQSQSPWDLESQEYLGTLGASRGSPTDLLRQYETKLIGVEQSSGWRCYVLETRWADDVAARVQRTFVAPELGYAVVRRELHAEVASVRPDIWFRRVETVWRYGEFTSVGCELRLPAHYEYVTRNLLADGTWVVQRSVKATASELRANCALAESEFGAPQ